MKKLLLKLASPILTPLENSEGDFEYSPTHRKVLKVMGFMFVSLGFVGAYFSLLANQIAGLLPVAIFAGTGIICLLVGYLGSDKAVSKLWRNRNETYHK